MSGDFETWIDEKYNCRAFGVRFSGSDVEKLLPSSGALVLPYEPADGAQEWLSARQASETVGSAMGRTPMEGLYAIIDYAKTGQVKARALTLQQMVRQEEESKRESKNHDVAIPTRFWEECIGWEHCALEWERGVFTVQHSDIGRTVKLVLTGVQFDAGGIELVSSLVQPSPAGTALVTTADESQTPKAGGRPRSELWRDWTAELALFIHEKGYPVGEGAQGQSELIDAIADRLAERGLEAPSRTTVQATVQAVLDRYRSAEK